MNDQEKAQIDLYVNGRPAIQALEDVKKTIESLKKQIKDTKDAGKEVDEKLQKDLNKANQQLRYIQSGAASVATVMKQINKATPDDLNKALKFLNRELKYIERGTPAWDAHVKKIKMVKAELEKVNSEMKVSKTLFERMKDNINNWGASFMAGVGAISGLVMAGKKAVNTYAEMQQEEANVRKYTGMTAEEVEHLNESFKKMDTRTGRDELNKLAQEAGRLGLQSEEDVLGFVKAADKINVALDDLGEGATLTLSKLTDIFGDKQRLGVEQSLLAVGSVINELSQNSTASAPYLAEFAQRLAGVGAQAEMSIPEIMGFGAVLDSQGQKLEMSATALSKVIMNLFKDPAKIASATGLAVEEFSETCKRSTNEGLLMLLDRLHELGGIDALAPVFKDMGENGARASAVLAALAGNVDMVRQQQEAANEAFREATSIDKEFEVQNTTVQAQLEKARKGFQEMAVTLGKELMPVMRYFISGTSATMRVMLKVIQFLKEHKTEVLSVTAAIVAYYTVMKAQDAWNAFVGGTKKAIEAIKAFNKALMSNPWAAAAALIAGITVALVGYIKKSREAARAADENRKALERQREAEKATASAVGEVTAQYSRMKAEWEQLSSAQAKKEWLDKNRDAFEQLGLNINNAVDADEAFVRSSDKVIAALQARAKANALQGLYEEKIRQVYEDAAAIDAGRRYSAGESAESTFAISDRTAAGVYNEESLYDTKSTYGEDYVSYSKTFTEEGARLINERLDELHQQAVADAVKIGEASVNEVFGSWMSAAQKEAASAEAATNGLVGNKPSGTVTGGTTGGGGGGEVDIKERLKQLEDEKKKELAINQIAYLQGEKDFKAYKEGEILAELNYQQARMGLYAQGTTEYLEAQAAYLQTEKKQRDKANANTVQDEQKRYSDEKAAADQRYADGKISAKAYQLEMERLELEHLQNLVNIYDEGSEERLKAQEKYNQTSLKYQQKHAQEAKKLQEQIQKAYFDLQELGMPNTEGYADDKAALDAVYNELSKHAMTNEQKLQLDEAYEQAKYELAKKYGDEAGMAAIDQAQATYDKMTQLFQGKGAKKFISAFSVLTDGLSNLFSGVTDLMQAETDLQTAQIEKRYDAEIKAAGNNKALVEQLEAEKAEEIGKLRTEQADKEFKMNVFMAIAQGALAAINAWNAGVGAGFPAGLILGPMMLAMSLAATGVQIAAMKKQHEAAMAQGYAAGGYTMPGSKYQPAGIVHAGEWVASQDLLANPTAAATIAQLDQAQRTNTIGQLSRPSPSVTPMTQAASQVERDERYRYNAEGDAVGASIDRLNKTLDGGIYAATLLTGDKGLLRAQKRHNQLLKNKGK